MNTNTQIKVYEIEILDLSELITNIELDTSALRADVYNDRAEEVAENLQDLEKENKQLSDKRTQLEKFRDISDTLKGLEELLSITKGFDDKQSIRSKITAANESLIAIVRGA